MNRTSFLALALAASTLFVAARPAAIPLNGPWQFRMDPEDVGITEGWSRGSFSETMYLPGSMPERGKGLDITLKTPWTGSVYDSSFYYTPRLAKFREPGNIKIPFMLTPEKHYVGVAWYVRKINIPADWKGLSVSLFLERVHTESRLFLDGVELGRQYSLSTPHEYDLTGKLSSGEHTLALRIDNRLKVIDVGLNSHSVSDQTQGNWNGVVGKMALVARNQVYLDQVQVYPDLAGKSARVVATVHAPGALPGKGTLTLSATSFNSSRTHAPAPVSAAFTFKEGNNECALAIPMGNDFLTWDEFDPALYRLQAVLTLPSGESDTCMVQFGMREFKIIGTRFFINGRETFLRGTVENCVFPRTGYPPVTISDWERVFRVCRSFGLNHMRFHSYCPPEAAFLAADLVGFYLQPEGPSWPNHSTSLGSRLPIDQYLYDETQRMERYYGNSPSFCMLTAGNEPRGGVAWMTQFVKFWKERDSRRVYAGASVGGSWPWQIGNEYHVRAGVRGLAWGARPETNSDFLRQIDTISIPFVTHEMGQWCAFPNFREIPKYTGVMRARNFELFQEDLSDSDMGALGADFLMASGKLQALCYKHEIEKGLRTARYAGFQLLCLNDYSGQGSAIVGVVDAFWDEKGYIRAEEFRKFCSPTVPLMRTSKFVYTDDETFAATAEVAHFGAKPITGARPRWRLLDERGKAIRQGTLPARDIPVGNCIPLGSIEIPLKGLSTPVKLRIEVSIEGTEALNDWEIWVYPRALPETDSEVLITSSLDEAAEQALRKGGKVLLLAAGKVEYGKEVAQQFTPVFWNTSWFKMRAPHTTGVLIQSEHPAFERFPTDFWGNIQWWELINRQQCMQLTDFPKGFQPLVQPIDTWFLNRKLGLLFEAQVGKGKIMVCSADITSEPDTRIVARQLRYSLLSYMNSAKFAPGQSVDISVIRNLFLKEGEKIRTFTTDSPDELKQQATKP
jgi:hypothetical protein